MCKYASRVAFTFFLSLTHSKLSSLTLLGKFFFLFAGRAKPDDETAILLKGGGLELDHDWQRLFIPSPH